MYTAFPHLDTCMHLPSYCERSADGLWAEPLNAVTNIAFMAAAWLAWRHWRTRPGSGWRHQPDVAALILLVAVIGIGSLLWHTVARPWAYWLDALPIVFFIHLFLLSFLRRIGALSWPGVLAVVIAYDGLTLAILATLPTGALNDSAGYLPVVLFLLLLTAGLRLRHHPLWRVLALASGLFGVSLLLRIVDPVLCEVLPTGTHFLWHLINGVLLYLLLRGLTDHVTPAGGRTP
jgi:hypothetical protein